jgi:DNA invertase Pin-like site-specific DNA recombinase
MNAKQVKPKRVALYVRVSTSEQNTRNQRRELKAVAEPTAGRS